MISTSIARVTASERRCLPWSLGGTLLLYIESEVAADGLIARIPPLERYAHGDTLYLAAAPDHCHLFDSDGVAFRRQG